MSTLLEPLTGHTLLDPWLLLLALLVPAGLLVRRLLGAPAIRFAPSLFIRQRGTSEQTAAPDSRRDTDALPGSWRSRLLRLPPLLQVIGLLLLVLALARPVLRDQLPLETEGIDILLCIDVSSSMAANDMDPRRTRLDVARDAASDFISGRPHDRIGLIGFARYPDLICPPTLDHPALLRFLSAVTLVENEGKEDATGIGTAVARAAQVLGTSEANSRVVILLTDGEENVATERTPEEIAPLHAAQLCEELDVRVYSIAAGIGRRTQTGNWVALETDQVERVARRTGGRFYEARDAGAVASVYGYINQLEKVELKEPRYRIEERFLPYLVLAVMLLLAGGLLQSTLLEVLP